MTVEVEKSLEAQLSGYVGRGVLSARINEEGHLILTMTDGENIDVGVVAAKVDKSLTKSGYAADAKATGERLSGIQHTANEACHVADDAYLAVAAAAEKALAALDAAGRAETAAQDSAQRAEDARRDARGATEAAGVAQNVAHEAKGAAEAAGKEAAEGKLAAENAGNAARAAMEKATASQTAAESAAEKANSAQAAANKAQQKADLAGEIAESLLKERAPAYVEEEAERVAAAVQSHQGLHTLSILVSSDFHHSLYLDGYREQFAQSLKHCGQAMNLVAKKAHLDASIRLGDYTWDNGQTPEEAMAEMRAVFAATHVPGLPEINTCGNHDGNGGGTAPMSILQIFQNIGIRSAGAVYAPDKVTGDCYRDFEAQKLRLIGLNNGNYFLTAEQLSWLSATLEAMEEGWQAVLFAHCPLNWNGSTLASQALAPYVDKILCVVHGHTHNCLVSTLEDTGIQQIAIPSANFTRTDEYAAPWADPETPHKEAGNAKDTAFCILTVDRNTATVYADHYGAGYSREVNVSKEEKPAYTNVLPKAASAWGGTDVYGEDYNGDGAKDGYKTGMRLNSSVQEIAVSGMCLTGIIHIQPGDVVRIKNITLTGSQTAYMGTFSSSGAAGTTAISILGSPDASGVYTWTNTAGYSAFRLSVGLIDGNSIVTVNEEIV